MEETIEKEHSKICEKIQTGPCKASVQTVSRYESVRDHRNFISLFCALEGLREMFGYPDDKTGVKKFKWVNCFSFDESTGCTLLQYVTTKVLRKKTDDKPPTLVVNR